jgi:hypothetical protein
MAVVAIFRQATLQLLHLPYSIKLPAL